MNEVKSWADEITGLDIDDNQNIKTYMITLTSGRELTNLTVNGSYYISDTAVTEETFLDNLYNVKISDGENETTHLAMNLVDIIQRNNKYWFALADRTHEEIERDRTWAAIEYMAMMSGIEI